MHHLKSAIFKNLSGSVRTGKPTMSITRVSERRQELKRDTRTEADAQQSRTGNLRDRRSSVGDAGTRTTSAGCTADRARFIQDADFVACPQTPPIWGTIAPPPIITTQLRPTLISLYYFVEYLKYQPGTGTEKKRLRFKYGRSCNGLYFQTILVVKKGSYK